MMRDRERELLVAQTKRRIAAIEGQKWDCDLFGNNAGARKCSSWLIYLQRILALLVKKGTDDNNMGQFLMDDDEIIMSYKRALHPGKQIGILADLNACKRTDIRKILEDAGVLVCASLKEKNGGTKRQRIIRQTRTAQD